MCNYFWTVSKKADRKACFLLLRLMPRAHALIAVVRVDLRVAAYGQRTTATAVVAAIAGCCRHAQVADKLRQGRQLVVQLPLHRTARHVLARRDVLHLLRRGQEAQAHTLDQALQLPTVLHHLGLRSALALQGGVELAQPVEHHAIALRRDFGNALSQLGQHGLNGVQSGQTAVLLQVLGQTQRGQRLL